MATIRLTKDEEELAERVRLAVIPDPAAQMRFEVRILTLYVAFAFVNDLLGPLAYLQQIAPSMLSRVASLSAVHNSVFVLFLLSLLMMIPHTVALAFFPKTLHITWPRKFATAAAALSAVTWTYMALLADPLDFQGSPLVWLYGRQALDNLWLAFIFALSLNNQQLRRLYEAFSIPR